MIALITAATFVVIAAGLAVLGRLRGVRAGTYGEAPAWSVYLTSGVSLAVALVILAVASTTIVPARTVGVGVAFGKTTGAYGNGLHLKAPWVSVHKFDGSVQNDVYNGDSQITVRLGNSSTAKADVSIQWRLKTDNAEQLYMDYKTFDSIQSNLVDRNLRASMNEVMAKYNPLSSVEDADNASGAGDLNSLSTQVRESLERKVGADIEVKSVTIPIINFDESTQTRIDELQAEIARTRVAEQRQDTAEAERRANEILDRSVSDNVLTSKCLDIVERSGQSPLGCFPGASGQPIIGAK